MATETTDSPFTIRSLIGEAGVGSNGEKLVNAIQDYYPDALSRAQLLKPNVRLSQDLALADVAKIVGDGVDVRDAVVRGGELRDSDAWVTYAGYDEAGDTVKGAFPYGDLGTSESEDHVSQIDSLQEGTAARDHAIAQAKAAAAASGAPTDDAGGVVDPIGQYEDMKATEVVAYLEANPDRADVIKALESATRPGDERKTIMEWEPKAPEDGGDGEGSGDGQGAGS